MLNKGLAALLAVAVVFSISGCAPAKPMEHTPPVSTTPPQQEVPAPPEDKPHLYATEFLQAQAALKQLSGREIVELRTYFNGQVPTAYEDKNAITTALEWLGSCSFTDYREYYPGNIYIDEEPDVFTLFDADGMKMSFTIHERFGFFSFRLGDNRFGVFVPAPNWLQEFSAVRGLYQEPEEGNLRAAAVRLIQQADNLKYIFLGGGLDADVPSGVPIEITGGDSDYYPVRSEQFRDLGDLIGYVKSTYISAIANGFISGLNTDRPLYKDKDGRLHVDIGQGGMGPLFSHDYATVKVIDKTEERVVVSVEQHDFEDPLKRNYNLVKEEGRWLLGHSR